MMHRFVFWSAIFLCAGLQAQRLPAPVFSPAAPVISDKTNEWTVDLLQAGADSSFQYLAVPINVRFPNTSVQLRYLIAGFDTLEAGAGFPVFSGKQPEPYQVDSVEILIKHHKVSGANDTFLVEMLVLDVDGYPTEQVLYSDSLISNQTFVPGGTFFPLYFLKNCSIPAHTSVGIRMLYAGGSPQDSLWLLAGANTDGICLLGRYKARKSPFYPHTFGYYSGYQLLLPGKQGGDLYEDCNENGVYDSLIDGENPLQALAVRLMLSGNVFSISPNEKTIDSYPWPNPGNGTFYLKETDLQDAAIYDVNGHYYGQPEKLEGEGWRLPAGLLPGLYLIRNGRIRYLYVLLP